MKFMTKKRAILLAVGIVLILLFVWAACDSAVLEVNTYTIVSDRLPDSFSGFRIAQVSDLHNAQMGDNNEDLLAMLREAAPDIIVITGDLISAYDVDLDVAIRFAEAAVEIAPCYYVPGNHEGSVFEYKDLQTGLKSAGVVLLENRRVELRRNGETITLVGVFDPSFYMDYPMIDVPATMSHVLKDLVGGDAYTILLSHRPELIDVYAEHGIDLVLSGHTHGGQLRLPYIGGVVAPNQGFFPEYDAGLYTRGNTSMLISRGIGTSRIPIRINNRPEILLVELQTGK